MGGEGAENHAAVATRRLRRFCVTGYLSGPPMFGDIRSDSRRRGFCGGKPHSIKSSARGIKRKSGLSIGTACRVLSEDLRAKSLRKVKKTNLVEKTKIRGLNFAPQSLVSGRIPDISASIAKIATSTRCAQRGRQIRATCRAIGVSAGFEGARSGNLDLPAVFSNDESFFRAGEQVDNRRNSRLRVAKGVVKKILTRNLLLTTQVIAAVL